MNSCIRSFLKAVGCSQTTINRIAPSPFDKMMQAIQNGDLNKVIYFHTKKDVKFNNYNENGNSPLHLAVQQQDFPIVQYILENVKNINKEDKNFHGDTILMIAVLKGNINMVKYLVKQYKLNINCKENDGYTPFMAACANGFMDIVQFFIHESNVNYSVKNNDGQNALHRASFYGQLYIIRYLLKNTKLSLLIKDKRGNNCLHMAAMRINMTCIRYMLKRLTKSKQDNEEEREKVKLQLLQKSNLEGFSPLDYLKKAFNTIKEEEAKIITEEEILIYIQDKTRPPSQLLDTLDKYHMDDEGVPILNQRGKINIKGKQKLKLQGFLNKKQENKTEEEEEYEQNMEINSPEQHITHRIQSPKSNYQEDQSDT